MRAAPRAASACPSEGPARAAARERLVQRIRNRKQFEAAMAGATVSRTPHFVLHRAPLEATAPRSDGGTQALFHVCDVWIGAMLPKRWAKRAVTRNGIKRQIYNVSAAFEAQLPQAAH